VTTHPLRGVRALLLDLDGVLARAGVAIPGAAHAVTEIERRGIPYRVVTNTSLYSRRSLAKWGESVGLHIPAQRMMSALSASAAYTAHHFPGRPLYVLASGDALTEFAGQRLLTAEEADAPDAIAAAVVIGDSPDEVSFDNLNRAFRLIRGGAQLIGMHKNRWWLTPAGPTLDSGAFVAGLEFAAETRARILGKPSPAFFREAIAALRADREAIAALRADVGRTGNGGRLRLSEIAMVGDDVWNDVLAARRLGMKGVFVRSGKHGDAELRQAASQPRGGGAPDLVAASLTEVVGALD
jgi:HAD superfamily hydrolase (TIGR01450 family)